MVRKLLTVLLLLGLNTLPLLAQTRSAAEAEQLANGFWPRSKALDSAAPEMVFTQTDSADQHPYFYVFNRGEDQGFVIISADTRSKQILGYSDTGHFNVDDVPPEMQKWLRIYQGELQELALTPDSLMKSLRSQHVLSKARAKGAQSFAPAVKPLLRDINFSQKAPYNAYCPQVGGQPCVAGCVATGAAQIMRYWQYPVAPTGKSHSYQSNGQQQAVTFDTAYDWENILPTYGAYSGSREQQLAVARLMADAGLSCNTAYSPSASGANTHEMAMALVNYFGYDRGLVPYVRSDMTEAEFTFYLKRELNAGRPVLVVGDGAGGCHCFVCDGYDEHGLFHINWGWNGMSNGYFQLSNLNPYALGTGGGTGGGFSDNIEVYGCIQPAQAGSQEVRFLSFASMSESVSRSAGGRGVFELTGLRNSSLFDFNGQVGVALYCNGQKQSILAAVPVALLSQYSTSKVEVPVELPRNLAAGHYELVVVSKDQRDDSWRACLNRFNNCVDLDVNEQGNYVLAQNNNTHYCDLPANGFDGNVHLEGSNSGGGNADSERVGDGRVSDGRVSDGRVSDGRVGDGRVGDGRVGDGRVSDGRVSDGRVSDGRVGTIIPTNSVSPGSTDRVAVTQTMTFVQSDVTSGNQTLQVNLQSERDYSGKVAIFLYDSTPQRCLSTLQTRSVAFGGGQPVTINFTGVISLPPGTYYAFFFYTDDEGRWTQATGPFASVPFNISGGVSTDMSYVGGHSEASFRDSGMAFAAPAAAEEQSEYLIDDGFWDDEPEAGNQTEGDASFEEFPDDVAAKDAGGRADIACKSLAFVGAQLREVGGRQAVTFCAGEEARLEFELTNQSGAEQTRLITLSLFDKDDHWVADLAECLFAVDKDSTNKGTILVAFSEVLPGAYRLRLTEARNEHEVSRPLTPLPTSAIFVQITEQQ
ncbi:MAG: C10 family peptidase [Bacteroidaceae bacterium]|nr:C10 family peptidase [Bacteroidaceae bacterium]